MRSKLWIAGVGAVLLAGLVWIGFLAVFPDEVIDVDEVPAPSATLPVASSAPLASASAPTPPPVAPPPPLQNLDEQPQDRKEQHEALFTALSTHYDLDDAAMTNVRKIFSESKRIGQGHPTASEHPMSKRECLAIREKAKLSPTYSQHCKGRYMVPIFNPKAGETTDTSKVCIDEFEFPGIPCEYPVTWVTSREAAQLCSAVGKRLCDAHEWEGACAGAVLPVATEYDFTKARKYAKYDHNKAREEVWAYGPKKDHTKCATGSKKSDKCGDGGKCGSNTYPTGAFPECVSSLGVYDLHGNAAEHMNLPTKPEELTSAGGAGVTEMKGSWFIFQRYEAHEDDCRWRAPDWHATEVMDHNSHANYHLGFRCCKSLDADSPPPGASAETNSADVKK